MAGRGDDNILQYFTKGAKVEASSDDPGFRGSWFEAIVIEPAESEFCNALVEYRTLKEEGKGKGKRKGKEKGKRPLRESVRLVLLRPSQPRENRPAYKFNDAVDAYFTDGWWEGYITGIYERNMYKVYFRGSRDEKKFPASKLRLHREWVKGRWIPPLDSEIEGAPSSSIAEANVEGIERTLYLDNPVEATEGVPERILKSGDLVEAVEGVPERIVKPGGLVEAVEGVPERIVKPGGLVEAVEGVPERILKPGGLVEAVKGVPECIHKPGNLVEAVEGVPERIHKPGGLVEAVEGVPERILKPVDLVEAVERVPECIPKPGGLVEAFEGVPERILRLGDLMEAIEEVTKHIFKAGDLVEASTDEEGFDGAWLPATIVKEMAAEKYIVEYEKLRNDDDTGFLREVVDGPHLRPRPPDVGVVDRFGVGDEVDALYIDSWWVGVIQKVLNNSRYYVYFENTGEVLKFKHSELRVHQEWENGKWHIAS